MKFNFLISSPFKNVYAQIDLRHSVVTIQDGYKIVGTVGTGGASIGATTVPVVLPANTAVVVGDPITFGTDTTTYAITAHTETAGSTTSITISPGLVVAVTAAEALQVGPHSLEVKIGDGTLNYSEKRKFTYTKNRGLLDTVKQDDDEPVDVKLDFTWEHLKASTGLPPTVEDALKQRGNASAWISSATGDPCAPYAVDIIVSYRPPCTQESKEIITLHEFRWEDLNHELKQGVVAVTGKCNITDASIIRIPA